MLNLAANLATTTAYSEFFDPAESFQENIQNAAKLPSSSSSSSPPHKHITSLNKYSNVPIRMFNKSWTFDHFTIKKNLIFIIIKVQSLQKMNYDDDEDEDDDDDDDYSGRHTGGSNNTTTILPTHMFCMCLLLFHANFYPCHKFYHNKQTNKQTKKDLITFMHRRTTYCRKIKVTKTKYYKSRPSMVIESDISILLYSRAWPMKIMWTRPEESLNQFFKSESNFGNILYYTIYIYIFRNIFKMNKREEK